MKNMTDDEKAKYYIKQIKEELLYYRDLKSGLLRIGNLMRQMGKENLKVKDNKLRAQMHFYEGLSEPYTKQDTLTRQTAHLEAAIKLGLEDESQKYIAAHELAELYSRRNNVGKAITYYKKAKDLQPNSLSDYVDLAKLYLKNNMFREADALINEYENLYKSIKNKYDRRLDVLKDLKKEVKKKLKEQNKK